ncbi:hypothetical protein RB195_018973 [Necator americanus]|uniref:Uncharacterized protein n=1 Tax=Necator americanus TaxID=51031 RepID=A0ABR1CC04_NECAM
MQNDLKEEVNRRMRTAWAAFAPGPTGGPRVPCPPVFQRPVTQRRDTWTPPLMSALRSTASRKLFATYGALERCLLKFSRRKQQQTGLRSSDFEAAHIKINVVRKPQANVE